MKQPHGVNQLIHRDGIADRSPLTTDRDLCETVLADKRRNHDQDVALRPFCENRYVGLGMCVLLPSFLLLMTLLCNGAL
jgi:hypothetical protein